MSRTVHRGTVANLGLLHPFQHSGHIRCCGGQPIGWNVDTGEVVTIDPWRWQMHGHIGAPIALTLGKINSGKTSLAKVLAVKLGRLKAKNGGRVRIALDDHRRNDGELEYEKLAQFMGSEETSLRSLNLLDPHMDMSRADNLRMLIDVAQYISRKELDHYDVMNLQVALNMMMDLHPMTADLEQLLLFLRVQQVEDVETYVGHNQAKLLAQLVVTEVEKAIYPEEESIWKVDLFSRLEEKMGIDAEWHRQAVIKLVFIFQRLLPGGDMSGVFGGKHSLASTMSQRVVAFDYAGLPPRLLGLTQSLIWRWKGAAQLNPNSRFAFNLEIHDENHKLWKDIEYAKAMSAYMKIIRTTMAFLILNSHRDGDYEAIAGQEGLLAQNALDEVEIKFLGGQPPNVARRIGKRFDLSTRVVNRMPTLGVGEFIMGVGSRAPVVVKTHLTKAELAICESNQANPTAV